MNSSLENSNRYGSLFILPTGWGWGDLGIIKRLIEVFSSFNLHCSASVLKPVKLVSTVSFVNSFNPACALICDHMKESFLRNDTSVSLDYIWPQSFPKRD